MKKLIYGSLFLAIVGIGIVSCEKNNSIETIPNEVNLEPQESFNSEGFSLGDYDNPFTDKELNDILSANLEKAAWPKIKITATFGGFFSGNGGNPCTGCEHCGCCLGLCIEITRSKLAYIDLTNNEINEQDVLFDFVDLPSSKHIVLIPKNNVDNGDGRLHVVGDNSFSNEVNEHIGRPIQLKEGSYKIVYLPGYAHGVTIIRTY